MNNDFEILHLECQKIRSSNQILLDGFETWLLESGLSSKTTRKHQENIDFYINEFLLYSDAIPPEEGMTSGDISLFMGYWFIKKALWASKTSLKSNAASLRKFGKFLCERGLISKDDLDSIHQTLNEEMPEWQATLMRYDDPNIIDSEEIWGY